MSERVFERANHRHGGELRIGCSGWSYRDWRGPVYPVGVAQRRWFAHYAQLFDTVELNSTFYRLPAIATVEQWAAAAPPGFVDAVKLGSFGSLVHHPKVRRTRSVCEHVAPMSCRREAGDEEAP